MNMTTTEKPYCTLELRQKLGLKPGQADSMSMMLWAAIYGSTSILAFENQIEEHISQLRAALEIVKGEK